MKRKLAALLATAMVMSSLTGCLNNTPPETKAPETKTETEAPAATEAPAGTDAAKDTEAAKEEAPADTTYSYNLDNIEEHTFSLSTTASSGSALADVTHYFADTVGELSGGKIKVDVYEGLSLIHI